MKAHTLLVLASTYPASEGDGTPAFVRDLARVEASRFSTTVLVPAVRGARSREQDGLLSVHRFHYYFRRSEDLAEGAILENLRSRPIRWLQVPCLFISELIAVRRLIRRMRPDVLHVHWLIPQGLVALIAARRLPKVVTTLGGDLYGLSDPISRCLIRAVVRNADVITTMNTDMRDRLIELGAAPGATHVLPMGADLEAIRSISGKQQRVPGRVLFVGRLVEKKGLEVLLRALRMVQHMDLELRIVGDGPLRRELEQQADGLAATFLGALGRSELAREYGTAALVVFPSVPATSGDQDGLPVALIEAMGAGCPVIASRLPGLADAVQDGISGLLVAPGDAKEIASAIEIVLADRRKASLLGQAATKRANAFSVESIGRRYVELLEEVAATRAT